MRGPKQRGPSRTRQPKVISDPIFDAFERVADTAIAYAIALVEEDGGFCPDESCTQPKCVFLRAVDDYMVLVQEDAAADLCPSCEKAQAVDEAARIVATGE